MKDRTFLVTVVAIAALGFLLRAYGLSSQPPSADDLDVAVSAERYLEDGHLGTMWNHPPLRNVLVHLSLSLLGGGAWGLKFFSVLFSTASIVLVAVAARMVFRANIPAYLAALFLALDPLHIDFSRQAIQEVYMPFFSLLGIVLALSYRDNRKASLLLLSGISFGCGIASKWYVAFPLLITLLFLGYRLLREPPGQGSRRLGDLALLFSALVVVPACIYLLAFLPWFQRGYGVGEWLAFQKSMFAETVSHSGYNRYDLELDSRAYLWFVKPVAYADFVFSKGQPVVILGMSNPVVWLLTIPSIAYLMYRGKREHNADYWYLAALFSASYVPLIATSRPIWAHTAFSVLPFAFLAIGFALWRFLGGRKRGSAVLAAYVVVVILAAIPLYLLATGKGFQSGALSQIVERYRPSHERQQ